ncbi:serine hydrolase [Thermococcus chitonophagus]|uniref:Beta-lactamase n=1 Tax=Thermococcus chitonophagus TaxID=54262 RepID=A0A160VS87_9EURY|nr:serine hydrolase [Thermococcus chitonophagus]ASJ17236.1 serine hydrolase [Thermococcus chitonophagus]CUX77855.1 Beta-lactamase [Thermococcus chitonophagus]
MEEFIVEKMKENKIPGISYGVIEGEKVEMRGIGFRNVEKALPATERTLYGIASVTKSFTALAIMKLVEEGKLDLNAEVESILGIELKPFGEPVRIHHLLTHSSGIPSLGYAEAFIDGFFGSKESWLPMAKPQDLVPFIKDMESWAVAKPGERFFYSNTGYVLLGLIIEKASGVSYEEFVRKEILEPLKMERTDFKPRDEDFATGYILQEGRLVPKPFPYGITSDGGLISCVEDLVKYLRMYITLEGPVGEEYLKLMEKEHIEVPWQMFGGEAYGYGLVIYPRFYGKRLVGHSGSLGSYTSFIGYIRDEELGVVVLENSSGYAPSLIGMYILAEKLGEDPYKIEAIRREEILKRFEGTYYGFKRTIKFTVKRRGDFLFLEGEWGSVPLVPEVVEEDYVRAFTLSGGRKMYAEFFLKDGKAEMLYERYRLVRGP